VRQFIASLSRRNRKYIGYASIAIIALIGGSIFVYTIMNSSETQPAIIVNNGSIDYEHYTERLDQLSHFYQQQDQAVDQGTLERSVLRQLVSEELINQSLAAHDISIENNDVEDRYRTISEQTGTQALNERLKQLYNIDSEAYKKILLNDLRREKLIDNITIEYSEWLSQQWKNLEMSITDERIDIEANALY